MNEHDPQQQPTDVPDDATIEKSGATRAAWERHYQRKKSRQSYPDENLVRLLARLTADSDTQSGAGAALDLGCGSGRHLKLLDEFGFAPIAGCDTSEASLAISAQLVPAAQVFAIPSETTPEDFRLPLSDGHCRIVVCWGVLHYNSHRLSQAMLAEIARVLAPGGECLGTLRARGDTHFQSNADMQGADIHLFDESQARELLANAFDSVELGYAERSPVGALDQRVCHWIFRAQRGPA